MTTTYKLHHRASSSPAFEFTLDERTVSAFPGQTVAAALLVAGDPVTRTTARRDEPRGYYCGMGVCWDCAVWVEGRGTVRACRTEVEPGMRVRRFHGAQPA